MLTPQYLAELPQPLVELYAAVESDILEAVIRRLEKTKALSETTVWQLEKLAETRALSSEIRRLLSKVLGASDKEVRALLLDAGSAALAYDDAIYTAAGLSPAPLARSPALQDVLAAGMRKTQGLLRNFTSTAAQTASAAFTNALDRAYMETLTGAFSRRDAVYRAIKRLANDGLHRVAYPSGYADSMETAVRRAVTTGVNQTVGELQLARADEMGCDLVETTSHAGARPDHAQWQGEVFSRSGKHPKYRPFEVTRYGKGDGLCGWNCRHSFYPFYEGISAPSFARNPAGALGKTNAQVYEESQTQRAGERAVRESRRKCAALDAAIKNAPDEETQQRLRADFNQASVTLKAREARLKAFCAQSGRAYDADRVRVVGFSRSASQKAVQANRREVEKYARYHYNKDGTIRITDDWKGKHRSIPRQYKPFAVVEKSSKRSNGSVQIDRTYYDKDGLMSLQVHAGDHNRPQFHNFGTNGEHMHKYTWIEGAETPVRTDEELDQVRRKENRDIL